MMPDENESTGYLDVRDNVQKSNQFSDDMVNAAKSEGWQMQLCLDIRSVQSGQINVKMFHIV